MRWRRRTRASPSSSSRSARDGEPAGAGLVNLPQDDNLTVAYADAMVHPDHRRRGVGTAVVDEIERRARAGGRSRVLIEVFEQPDGDGG